MITYTKPLLRTEPWPYKWSFLERMLEWNWKPICPLLVPVWLLLGQAIFTSLGLFLPLKIEVWITWTLSSRWPIQHNTVNSMLPSRKWQKWQQGISVFLSLHLAITGGFSNTLHLLFEPFPQHHPTWLQVQDPHSTSLLWQRDGSALQLSLVRRPSACGRSPVGSRLKWGEEESRPSCRATPHTWAMLVHCDQKRAAHSDQRC